jgi:D-cysteine desulfhydrase
VRQGQARNVLRSLEIEHQLGAELHRLDGGPRALLRLFRSLVAGRRDEDEPRLPYVVWPRRAATLGALGYVNAALELRRQITVGILPEPDRIYVPMRSGTAAAGLLLGCELAGIRSTIVGVATATGPGRQPYVISRRAARLLRRLAHRMQAVAIRRGALETRREFVPGGGLGTPAAHHSAGLLRDLESLDLDATYGARTMAALVQDARTGRASGPVLFWHAHPAGVFGRETRFSAEALPREFREFFVAS